MRTSLDTDTTLMAGQAAFWVARLHSDQATRADEARFAEWLAEQPERQAAYDEAERTWLAFERLRTDNYAQAAFAPLRAEKARSRRTWITGAFGLAAASAAGVALYLDQHSQTYATGVGELRRARLADGSTISLNTSTRVRVQLDGAQRRIWLDHGQAHFAVAHDPTRPFRVFVGDEEVRALGTAFEVRREGDRVQVILEEGSVALYRGDTETVLHADAPPELVLQPGQAADIEPMAIARVERIDLRRSGAWRQGQLIFDAEPLARAVAEVNRYHERKIVLADPSLNDIRISGVFQTGRLEAFADSLTAAFPIEIAVQNEAEIRLAGAPAPAPAAHP